MNPIGYDMILANIAKVDVNGSQVEVTWTCAATGREQRRQFVAR